MPKITIDHKTVEVNETMTILQAARQVGIDIPTLCHAEGIPCSTSCLVCMVRLPESNRFVPACATRVTDGMQIESETPEVHRVRREALELLLSEHVGDCQAPCRFGCPAWMNIPEMLRLIARHQYGEAIAVVKEDIALPGVLGYICSAPCELACRRGSADQSIAICRLKRFVAEMDLRRLHPYRPPVASPSGRRVAVIGAGATGLSAAYYLRRAGHECHLFERGMKPGGRLLAEVAADRLPEQVLQGEIEQIRAVGTIFSLASPIKPGRPLGDLLDRFDAVLLACGDGAEEIAKGWGLDCKGDRVAADRDTYRTSHEKVFAAGAATRKKCMPVRSVADGKEAAQSIDRYLRTGRAGAAEPRFSVRMGKLSGEELHAMVAAADEAARNGNKQLPPREKPLPEPLMPDEAAREASACLHCDCRDSGRCDLERLSRRYGADPRAHGAARPTWRADRQPSGVIFEPGKCIKCELCVKLTERAGGKLGLTFVGRGFGVKVAAPLGHSLDEALGREAEQVIRACPTGALAWEDDGEKKK